MAYSSTIIVHRLHTTITLFINMYNIEHSFLELILFQALIVGEDLAMLHSRFGKFTYYLGKQTLSLPSLSCSYECFCNNLNMIKQYGIFDSLFCYQI